MMNNARVWQYPINAPEDSVSLDAPRLDRPPLGARLSAVQLGKQTGAEWKRAAAGTLLAPGSLGEILYCL